MSDDNESATAVELLAGARATIEQLTHGLQSRTVIGQAEGILMERLGIDAEQAITYLRRASNERNRKLADVAAEIVETRELPDLP